MMQLDFVLHRFVCDVPTFTGLFAEDAEGRHIPDAASFQCSWARTSRAQTSSSGRSALHCVDGATENMHFKALGDDMALMFAKVTHQLILDAEQDVITFAIRPSQYSAAGPLPVVAKGALDPRPYFGKPMKNYAIKLRDAAGEVTGKLLFSLRVHEIDEKWQKVQRGNTVSSTATTSPPRSSPHRGQITVERDSSRDRLLRTPPRSEQVVHVHSHVLERQKTTLYQHRIKTAQRSHPRREGSRHLQRDSRLVRRVEIQLERVTIRTESIDLDHPAPLLLGGDYSMKIRYGSYTYRTTQAVCCNPKEVMFKAEQARITLQPADGAEKLRFSLWEDKRQVAGFSLNPAKFQSEVGEWKEYAIPFRYHPTGQRAALDVRICRVEIDSGSSPSSRRSPSLPSAAPNASSAAAAAVGVDATAASRAAAQQWTYGTDPPDRYAEKGTHGQTPLRFSPPPKPYDAVNLIPHDVPLVHTRSSSHRGGSSPPGSFIVASGPIPPLDANRTSTPLRGCQEAGARGGWERTPMGERPPPLTSNLADLPAARRPPDEHEVYIAEVLRRLERQQRAPRQPTSLVEEWIGWRNERERSHGNSISSMYPRSSSVKSAASRADSMTSVVSRRALTPRPTKSNAEKSFMTPFTPDASAHRRRSSRRSPTPLNPLI
ncbi:bilobe protein, conserved [Leishmania donovani]|uniref:Bilobe protein, conserved n=1 Tax=Leishmania donovani TaxID=5661 RepID=A0A3S7XBZ6_LEIDO|nr:bilobe protein, conserved [Leishmania donovani]